MTAQGILLVNKPLGISSFALVAKARKKFGVKKIGHGGTLDPFATGLVILLIGKAYTKRASEFLQGDKAYQATITLGCETDTYDLLGKEVAVSEYVPTLSQVQHVLQEFQGKISQVPPMYSAKKVGGTRLYELARKGQVIDRAACSVEIYCTLVSYTYPNIKLEVTCSKGTYIRSLAHDIGEKLGSWAHLSHLCRTRSSSFLLRDACEVDHLDDLQKDVSKYLICK